jgi:uncharacterized membrane-anchored protein YjiN (DUF445 family)
MLEDTPYRKRQIIAITLLSVAGTGLAGTMVLKHNLPSLQTFLTILEHGFEGGLVGGLCDWFAVWKTYQAIEDDSAIVAEEIGKWVSRDLLDQKTLQSQLDNIINNPASQTEIIKILDTYFDTQENTKKILDRLWIKIENPVIDFIVNYNFSSSEIQIISDTANDQIIIDTIKICIGDTLIAIAEENRFQNALNQFIQEQNVLTKFFSIFINIPDILKNYGEKLKSGKSILSEEEQYLDNIVTLISLSVDKYILSWQNLSLEQRNRAVEALLYKVKEMVGDALAKFIIEHKNELKARRTLGEYRPVKEFFKFIESKLDENVSNYIGVKISERLKSQNPKDFRKKLEWQTRRVLENIRINGTLLGIVLGLGIGILNYFL